MPLIDGLHRMAYYNTMGNHRITQKLKVLCMVINLMLFGIALFQYYIDGRPADIPDLWDPQFYFLLAVALGFSLVAVTLAERLWAVIPLLLSLVSMVVAVTPEGSRIGIRLCLFAAAAITGGLCVPPPYNLAMGPATIIAAFASIRTELAWDVWLVKPDYSERLGSIVVIAVTFAMAASLAYAIRTIRETQTEIGNLENTIAQLTTANIGFQEYAKYVEEQSREFERKRITKEIHDIIGYTLTTVIMLLREAKLYSSEQPRTKNILEEAEQQCQSGLAETRQSLRHLRTIETSAVPLVDAIRKLAHSFQHATGVQVKVDFGNAIGPVSESAQNTIIRLLQEGMTNALRHGKASAITISLWVHEGWLIIDMMDNGRGTTEFNEGIGLAGMRENIAALGGLFHAGPITGGFKLTAHIPLTEEANVT
jgi:signal transduction histidine kinase